MVGASVIENAAAASRHADDIVTVRLRHRMGVGSVREGIERRKIATLAHANVS